jgi:hypothetical protein
MESEAEGSAWHCRASLAGQRGRLSTHRPSRLTIDGHGCWTDSSDNLDLRSQDGEAVIVFWFSATSARSIQNWKTISAAEPRHTDEHQLPVASAIFLRSAVATGAEQEAVEVPSLASR